MMLKLLAPMYVTYVLSNYAYALCTCTTCMRMLSIQVFLKKWNTEVEKESLKKSFPKWNVLPL